MLVVLVIPVMLVVLVAYTAAEEVRRQEDTPYILGRSSVVGTSKQEARQIQKLLGGILPEEEGGDVMASLKQSVLRFGGFFPLTCHFGGALAFFIWVWTLDEVEVRSSDWSRDWGQGSRYGLGLGSHGWDLRVGSRLGASWLIMSSLGARVRIRKSPDTAAITSHNRLMVSCDGSLDGAMVKRSERDQLDYSDPGSWSVTARGISTRCHRMGNF
ncbi:hypothetical protein HAX54_028805 [Datura stramonium]|uniref:Uncharacterized protein n=1 Tax=Datura stramonium TaxID=4076 RepID=A0ABS8V511_DATST|nr:hypothetical protein [Datura stramonium]